jgi:hypothetical protein
MRQAIEILNAQEDGLFVSLSKEDSEALDAAYEAAMREALQVDTTVLTQSYEGLGHQYNEKFVTGLQNVIDGSRNSEALKQLRGNMLLNQWNDWYGENFDAIWDAL